MRQYPESVRIYGILIDFAEKKIENIFHIEILKGASRGRPGRTDNIYFNKKDGCK